MPGNPNFDSLLTVVLNKHMPELKDTITTKNPILNEIKKHGGKRTEDGSAAWVQGLDFTVNPTVKSMGQFDILDTTYHDPFTSSKAEPKIIAGTYQMTKFQEWQNSGSDTRIHNWLKGIVSNLRRSFSNVLDVQLHGDGTGNGSKDITGVALLVEEGTAWSTVQGINSDTYSNWRNQWVAGGVFSTTGIDNWTKMVNNCTYDGERPELIETTQAIYELYHIEMTKIQRIVLNVDSADMGVKALDFMGIPVMFNPNVLAGYTYFYNFNSLHWVVGKGYDMDTGPMIEAQNTIARIGKCLLFANLMASNRRLNGVVTAQTAS